VATCTLAPENAAKDTAKAEKIITKIIDRRRTAPRRLRTVTFLEVFILTSCMFADNPFFRTSKLYLKYRKYFIGGQIGC
jgi:hypothetical protein